MVRVMKVVVSETNPNKIIKSFVLYPTLVSVFAQIRFITIKIFLICENLR